MLLDYMTISLNFDQNLVNPLTYM